MHHSRLLCVLWGQHPAQWFQTGHGFTSAWRASVNIWICISRPANLLACCPLATERLWFFFSFNNPYRSVCASFWDRFDSQSLGGCRRWRLPRLQSSALHPFVSRLWWIKQLDVQQHPPSSLCHCLCLTSTCPHFMLKYGSSGCMVRKHAVGTFL